MGAVRDRSKGKPGGGDAASVESGRVNAKRRAARDRVALQRWIDVLTSRGVTATDEMVTNLCEQRDAIHVGEGSTSRR